MNQSYFSVLPEEIRDKILDEGTFEEVESFLAAYYIKPPQEELDKVAARFNLPYSTSLRVLKNFYKNYTLDDRLNYCVRCDDIDSFRRLLHVDKDAYVSCFVNVEDGTNDYITEYNANHPLNTEMATLYILQKIENKSIITFEEIMVILRQKLFHLLEVALSMYDEESDPADDILQVFDCELNEGELLTIMKAYHNNNVNLKGLFEYSIEKKHYKAFKYALYRGFKNNDATDSILPGSKRSEEKVKIYKKIFHDESNLDIEEVLYLYDNQPNSFDGEKIAGYIRNDNLWKVYKVLVDMNRITKKQAYKELFYYDYKIIQQTENLAISLNDYSKLDKMKRI